jgi:hypothetical protein
MQYVDVAPGKSAYTPAMWELKTILEQIMSDYEYGYPDDIHSTIFLHKKELIDNLRIVLAQDILYKIGVPYEPGQI